MLNDFYTLHQVTAQVDGGKTRINAHLTINPLHQIFEGHFPGLPIVPGVCMVQIIKEIAERELNRKLVMTAASNIKFLSVINPENNSEVNAEIALAPASTAFDVEAKLFFGDLTFFKIKAVFSSTIE